MVPLTGYSTVSGVPVTQLLTPERIEAITTRTKTAGGEIVGLLKTGSAYYAPSAAAAEMAEAIIRDQKRVIPCAVHLNGQYGVNDIFIGVPARLGAGGVEEILEIELNAEEKKAFLASVNVVKGLVADLKL
jgi:malate dehydrogenase